MGRSFTIPRLSGDKEALKICLSNIFKNATQHTFGGEIKIVTLYDETKCELHVAVMDTGTGIAKNKLENLKSGNLGQIKRSIETGSGAGLGFFVSRKLISIYDGKLEIESHCFNQSTVVKFSMQFNQVKDEEIDEEED